MWGAPSGQQSATLDVVGLLGVCFEQTNLYEQMSAQENLRLFARLFGVADFDADALLERVGLAGRERDRVESYSKGLKRRLMVARSLVNGGLKACEIILDRPETAEAVAALFSQEQVVTLHSEEATLEDIFIRITGRGLAG